MTPSLPKQPLNESRDNNFDFLRAFAALLVLWSHSHDLLSQPESIRFWGMSPSTIGLTIFFVISGYLVSKSAINQPTAFLFFKRRTLRIWPGLAVNIIVLCLIVGPAFTSLSFAEYFQKPKTWMYLLGLFVFTISWKLPGVWQTNPNNSPNGSLWTIPHEAALYGVTWLGKKIGLFKNAWLLLVVSLCSGIWVDLRLDYFEAKDPHLFLLSARWFVHFFTLYFLAAFFGLIWDKKKIVIFLASGSLLLECVLSKPGHWHFYTFVFAASAILFVGKMPGGRIFHRITRGADYSYGLYLWAFPIQQALIGWDFQALRAPIPLFLASFAITMPFAILSWHLVEKPALKMIRPL